jgi:hypothetical protein
MRRGVRPARRVALVFRIGLIVPHSWDIGAIDRSPKTSRWKLTVRHLVTNTVR